MTDPEGLPAVDAITIVVRSLPTSLAFYRLVGVEAEDVLVGCCAFTELGCGVRLEWTVESSPSPTSAPHDAGWGARVCRVLDPDGNTVELYAPWP